MVKYLMFLDRTIYYAKTEQDAVKQFSNMRSSERLRVKAYRLSIEINMFALSGIKQGE